MFSKEFTELRSSQLVKDHHERAAELRREVMLFEARPQHATCGIDRLSVLSDPQHTNAVGHETAVGLFDLSEG